MTVVNTTRESKGRPTGGRFASAAHQESVVELDFNTVNPDERFTGTAAIEGCLIDGTGSMQYLTVAVSDDSFLDSLREQVRSDDLDILHCSGTWALVTAAGATERSDQIPNAVLTQAATTLGLREDDGSSYRVVHGRGVFVQVDRTTGALTSLTGRKMDLMQSVFAEAKSKVGVTHAV
jgi:hypothetical protein